MTLTSGVRSVTALRAVRLAAASGCAVVAVVFAAWNPLEIEDPVAMPTIPPPMTAIAAALAAALLAGTLLRDRWRAPVVTVAACLMLGGSLLAIPHTVLMVIVRAGQMLTGGSGSFSVEPSIPATLAHGANVAATALTGWFLLRDRRLRRGLCSRCGRVSAAPSAAAVARWLRPLAVLAVVGALPYGALKLAWSVGSEAGLTGDGFSAVTPTSPGFGDTVLLTALAIAVAVAMGARVSHRVLRRALLLIGSGASLMLLPVGVTAMMQLITLLISGGSIDDSQIAPWAFALVYASFLVWGTAMAALTFTYWKATRASCAAHLAPSSATPLADRPAQ